jgi:hypothetical protein
LKYDIFRADLKDVDAMDIAIQGVVTCGDIYPYDFDLSHVVRCHAMLSSNGCELVNAELGENFVDLFDRVNPYKAVALLRTIDDSAQGLSYSCAALH